MIKEGLKEVSSMALSRLKNLSKNLGKYLGQLDFTELCAATDGLLTSIRASYFKAVHGSGSRLDAASQRSNVI